MKQTRKLILAAALAALTAVVLAAYGGSGSGHGANHGGGGAPAAGPGNATDAAFVNGMIPHHESAVEMAEVAQERGEHPQIKKLASDITTAQETEIGTMTPIKAKLSKEHGDAQMKGHGSTEMSDSDMSTLASANPFDREFIDMMVPHHGSAVTMAKEELAKGENETLRKLAEDIISAQEREISQMRSWREKWYGSADAGGQGGAGSGGHGEMDGH